MPAVPIDIDIAYVARLARIGLTPEELESYGAELETILEHAARLQVAGHRSDLGLPPEGRSRHAPGYRSVARR